MSVKEAKLFDKSECMPISRDVIDKIAVPIGDYYGDEVFNNYLNFYAGIARKYRPKRIFEVGTRYGYIAICMMLGATAEWSDPQSSIIYRGIDDESYHQGSCSKANANFRQVTPWADALAIYWNSFSEWPDLGMTFDMIHIDGNHDFEGVSNDLKKAWPILNPGGLILLDDATKGYPIWDAIMDFFSQHTDTKEKILWQYQENERNHVYVKKAK